MRAFEEMVSTGVAGQATLDMLLEVTAQTVRARNYPDPAGLGRWSADDVAELSHEVVVACSDGRTFVDTMLSSATDEGALRSVVARRVRMAFAQRSRKTDSGHLAGRVAKLLRDDAVTFTLVVGQAWTLTHMNLDAGESDAVTFEDLLRATHAVPGVRMTRWSAGAERRSAFASREDLTRLVTAALTAAGQPVRQSVLIKVLSDYFGLDPQRTSMDVSELPFELSDFSDAADEGESAVVSDMIWVQLNEDERAILPWLEDSLSDAATALGWSKTRAHNVRTAARTVLARAMQLSAVGVSELMTAGEAASVLRRLQERAASEPEVGP